MNKSIKQILPPSEMSCIALTIRSPLRFFSLALAKRLKDKYGSAVHAYCDSEAVVRFVARNNSDGRFESIKLERVLFQSALDQVSEEEREQVLETAQSFEKRLGLTYNFLAVSSRHLGRGYVLAGFHHPRSSYSENVDYYQMLNAYNKTLSFWDEEVKRKGITAIVNNAREPACIADLHGIPYRIMIPSKLKNLHFWAWDAHFGTPLLERTYKILPDDARETMEEPYSGHLANHAKFLKSARLSSALKRCYIQTRNHIYWRLTNHPKARGYFLGDSIKASFRIWREAKRLKVIAHKKLADMEGKRFVFYPLQMEPEAAIHMTSPEYFFQLSTIAAISRDLPAGVTLVVKEHYPNIGRRPDNFYRQITDMKNVVLLDTIEFGFNIVSQSEAVITITGTAGLEAAMLGKPVITFGRHNHYCALPHVTLIKDFDDLKPALHAALENPPDKELAKRNAERFLRAIKDCSFDMYDYDYVNLEKYSQSAVDEAADSLADSMRDYAAITAERAHK